MSGKIVSLLILIIALSVGAGVYYFQVYGWYDRVVLEDLAPDARDFEGLNAHDVGLTRVRRLMTQMAEQQLSELAAHQAAA